MKGNSTRWMAERWAAILAIASKANAHTEANGKSKSCLPLNAHTCRPGGWQAFSLLSERMNNKNRAGELRVFVRLPRSRHTRTEFAKNWAGRTHSLLNFFCEECFCLFFELRSFLVFCMFVVKVFFWKVSCAECTPAELLVSLLVVFRCCGLAEVSLLDALEIVRT